MGRPSIPACWPRSGRPPPSSCACFMRAGGSPRRSTTCSRPPYRDLAPFWAVVLGKLLREVDGFDVVHSHLDYFGFPLARALAGPVLTTLHGRLDLPELGPLYREYRDIPLVSISDAQRQPVPQANWVTTVYHGIDLDAY